MDNPPGQRGYRVRSIATSHFLTSGNVLFDENFTYNFIHSLPGATSTAYDYSTLPFLERHDSGIPAAPDFPPNPSNLDESTLWPPDLDAALLALEPPSLRPHSSHIRTCSRERLRVHLMKVREAAAWRGGVGGSGDDDKDENSLAALCNNGTFDNHSLHMDSVAMAASLDCEGPLQRNVDSLCEGPLLSIWSDVRRNPYAEGYDMSIPSATHWEAEQRMDEEWRKVTGKGLWDLKKMRVYEDVEEFPKGKKPIGCRWVNEFKINESGGPPVYKARLVAQGCSRLPFVDYGATFAPVTKSVIVQFVTVYSALQAVIFTRCPLLLPPGLWHLLKSVYGLKQASRICQWYCLLRKRLGFSRLEFVTRCFLAMHVDDGLAGCNSDGFQFEHDYIMLLLASPPTSVYWWWYRVKKRL